MARKFDPHQQVTATLNKRRGFVDQAEIQEQRRSVARLDVVGENPTDFGEGFDVAGPAEFNESVTLRWPIDVDDRDFSIVGVANDIETRYVLGHYEPGAFQMTWYNLWNNSGLLALGSSVALNDAYIIVYSPAVLKFWNDVAAETMSIDPQTGNIATVGTLSLNGREVGISQNRWESGAHADAGMTTLSVKGMPAWTSAGAVSNDGTSGAYNAYTTTAVINNAVGPNGPLSYRPDWTIDCTFHVSIVDIANVRIHVGLYASDPSGVSSPTVNMAGFRFDTGLGAANWGCRTADGAAGATTDSGVPTVVGSVYLRMVISTASVLFYINGVLVVTRTTNLPTSTALLAPYIRITTLAAATKAIRFGYFNALSQ